jgi:hypothetical protein
MSVTVKCYVEPQSRKYADGLEIVEAYVKRQWEPLISKPPAGTRVPIVLIAKGVHYLAALRTYPKEEWIYLCPDLKTTPGDVGVSLARILDENGYRPKDDATFIVENDIWQLKPAK